VSPGRVAMSVSCRACRASGQHRDEIVVTGCPPSGTGAGNGPTVVPLDAPRGHRGRSVQAPPAKGDNRILVESVTTCIERGCRELEAPGTTTGSSIGDLKFAGARSGIGCCGSRGTPTGTAGASG
jgi:hypothetical protein